jgi:LPXTG-motif cell wall-anchored protein
VTADRAELLIDDRLSLALRVEGPPDLAVEFPDQPGRTADWTLLERRRNAGPAEGAATAPSWEEVYLLQPERVGELDLPELAIRYRTSAQPTMATLAAPLLAVTVASVLPPGAGLGDLRGFTPPAELEARSPLPELAVIGALLLLGALLVWRRRRREVGVGSEIDEAGGRSPVEQLDALERAGLLERGRLSELYAGLSQLLREHIRELTAVDALARTTAELRSFIGQTGNPLLAVQDSVVGFLEECDRVKFARWQPPPEAAGSAISRTRAILAATTPAASPAPTQERPVALAGKEVADPA